MVTVGDNLPSSLVIKSGNVALPSKFNNSAPLPNHTPKAGSPSLA